MIRKSLDEVRVLLATVINDNKAYDVKPSEVRQVFLDFFDAIAPAYGTLTLPSNSAQTFGTAPVRMAWTGGSTSKADEITANAGSGSIIRTERGTTEINFTTDFYCVGGREVTFTLYRNGSSTHWSVTGTGRGSNAVAVAFTGIDYADPAPEYYIMARASVNGTDVTMNNGVLIASIQPVNSYV